MCYLLLIKERNEVPMTADSQGTPAPSLSNNGGAPKLYKNPISLAGLALAVVAFANILFLFFLDSLSHVSSP